MDKRLKVYRASAGSGKTHTLTYEYLRLALSDATRFERIQAVTFTNKATEEMKSRILRELFALSQEGTSGGDRAYRSPFMGDLSKELGCAPGEVSRRARSLLRRILLDYSRFRVSTIDSFFQEVVRAFTRELGLQGGFRLELESQEAILMAVTGVITDLDTLDNQDERVRWILEVSHTLIREGKNHDLRAHLRNLANELQNETVKAQLLTGSLPSRQDLAALQTFLRDYIASYKQRWADIGKRIRTTYDSSGLTLNHMSSGASGGLGLFYKEEFSASISNKALQRLSVLPRRLVKAHADLSSLFRKGDQADYTPIVERTNLPELLDEYINLVSRTHPHVCLAIAIVSELGAYGLISDIEAKLEEQQSKAGMLLLSDTPTLIHRILSDESGGDFIYEKIGTRIEHQMIDEFQDTSRMQYEDFRPLLQESLASGHENLIVGDVKQSIYRWRGSDSNLLGRHVHRDFAGMVDERTLRDNWRSAPEIVHFNNALYPNIVSILTDEYRKLIPKELPVGSPSDLEEELQAIVEQIAHCYADVEQSVPDAKAQTQGLVLIHRLPPALTSRRKADEEVDEAGPDEEAEDTPSISPTTPVRPETDSIEYQLPMTIVDLQSRGYRPCDIAILVRSKRDAKQVAAILQHAEQWLGEQERSTTSLKFISGEALEVGRNPAARLIIAALTYISAPSSVKAQHDLCQLYHIVAGEDTYIETMHLEQLCLLGSRSLYETIEAIVEMFSPIFAVGDRPYIIKLLDLALGFQQDLSVDIVDFLTLWHTRARTATLQAGNDETCMHLMTIHKSKGLDFPVVLLPYPTWSLERDNPMSASYLWCQTTFDFIPQELRERVPIVPVLYGKHLLDTALLSAYMRERIALALDSLNMLYVATTRASHELHLWLPESFLAKKGAEVEPAKRDYSSINRLLFYIIEDHLEHHLYREQPLNVPAAPDLPRYRPKADNTSDRSTSLTLPRLTSHRLDTRIAVLRQGLGHFVLDNQLTYGTIMHRVFSRIHTVDELDTALNECLQKGELSDAQYEEVFSLLREALNQDTVRSWFDGSGEVLCEVPIVGGESPDSRRPDRIVLYPDGSAVVIDYKFGQPRRSYHRQVREYVRLLHDMGYAPVSGYLWYFGKQSQIVPVLED